MPGTRELTRRIKSVKNTRKVTRAMQLVSAAKMRKSQAKTVSSRGYATLAWEIISKIGETNTYTNPLIEKHTEAKKVGVIFISTNRGLVGGFNSNLLTTLRKLREENPEIEYEMIAVGKKGRDAMMRRKMEMLAEFEKPENNIEVQWVYPVAKLAEKYYATGEYKQIILIYNQFVSTLVQTPVVKELLPLMPEMAEEEQLSDFLYEPSVTKVLDELLPRVLESKLYQALLESDASEHSARMIMMKNATDSAGDLISDLTLTYNQLRQNKITTELSEITAGKIALEG
jgi:F-type H+-transporting ATPase subunit gamma